MYNDEKLLKESKKQLVFGSNVTLPQLILIVVFSIKLLMIILIMTKMDLFLKEELLEFILHRSTNGDQDVYR